VLSSEEFYPREINRLDMGKSRKCEETAKNRAFPASVYATRLRIAEFAGFFKVAKRNGPPE
jgi:hypothetical protein